MRCLCAACAAPARARAAASSAAEATRSGLIGSANTSVSSVFPPPFLPCLPCSKRRRLTARTNIGAPSPTGSDTGKRRLPSAPRRKGAAIVPCCPLSSGRAASPASSTRVCGANNGGEARIRSIARSRASSPKYEANTSVIWSTRGWSSTLALTAASHTASKVLSAIDVLELVRSSAGPSSTSSSRLPHSVMPCARCSASSRCWASAPTPRSASRAQPCAAHRPSSAEAAAEATSSSGPPGAAPVRRLSRCTQAGKWREEQRRRESSVPHFVEGGEAITSTSVTAGPMTRAYAGVDCSGVEGPVTFVHSGSLKSASYAAAHDGSSCLAPSPLTIRERHPAGEEREDAW
mmetsp:Transcript_7563/g.22086  ORF Transcript_7563/g.22086 Transcript_7563/m.22086 type:complete len:348 (+) Transcript_7563:547-1590(+)